MNRERLTQLIRVLREVEDGTATRPWDMGMWFGPPGHGVLRLTCETSACAWGHCAVDGWFQQQGVRVEQGVLYTVPSFRGELGHRAASLFFGIGQEDSRKLFFTEYYTAELVTPEMVRERVEDLLRDPEGFHLRHMKRED